MIIEKIRKIIDKYFWIIFIGFILAIFFVLFSMVKSTMASFPYDAKTLDFQYTSPGTYNLISDTATKTILYIGVNSQDDTKIDLTCAGATLFNSNKWQSSGFFLQAKCAGEINITTDKANVFITMTYVEYDYAINPPVFAVSADTPLNFQESGIENYSVDIGTTTASFIFRNVWTAPDIMIVGLLLFLIIVLITKFVIGAVIRSYVSIKRKFR